MRGSSRNISCTLHISRNLSLWPTVMLSHRLLFSHESLILLGLDEVLNNQIIITISKLLYKLKVLKSTCAHLIS